jgi:heptosyltransferase-2/heptosyltransferase-3
MNPTAPVTPLVVRFGAFGDMLLLIPMLKALAHRYGRPCDLVSAGPWTQPLMQRVPACGPVRLITSRKMPYLINRSQQQLVTWLRQRPAGPVYVFEADEKSHALLARGGVSPDLICSIRDFPRRPGEHIAAHAVRLARQTPVALGGPGEAALPETDMRPTLSATDRQDCTDWLARQQLTDAPLVLVQPGNKKTMRRGSRTRSTNVKYWPEDHWARVIGAVRQTLPAAQVLICGSPAERPLAEDIRRRSVTDGIIIATDDLPIPRLLALQERAHSMISVDTGPAHSAAAMGCPLVVMFARIDPQLYAPLPTTAPVRLLAPEAGALEAAMASIPPERVIDTWRTLAAG